MAVTPYDSAPPAGVSEEFVVLSNTSDPAAGGAPNAAHILIVDDNPPTARALSKLLKKDYRTTVVHRGGDALEAARTIAFDAAFVDIHLPDLSGLVVSRKLREQLRPGAPIIVLSGDTSMQTLNSLPHVGATYFFSKPVSASLLMERLKGWLSAGGAAA